MVVPPALPDFRSDRMDSSEGKGIARRAWDAYADAVKRSPLSDVVARKLAAPVAMDLTGFWLLWHMEGGFEGLRRLGMSRASIYRRIKLFRAAMGAHPDEYVMPGVTIDYEALAAAAIERGWSSPAPEQGSKAAARIADAEAAVLRKKAEADQTP